MPKLLSHIRRDRIDRLLIGLHTQKIENKEEWYEAGHLIKGASFGAKLVTEKTGDAQELSNGAGMLIDASGEFAQNTPNDYLDYAKWKGTVNIAIVTGKEPAMMLRLFRLHYLGATKWEDNRVSITIDDAYNSLMDKAPFKISGWVRSFERYLVSSVAIKQKRLSFDIISGEKIDFSKHV
jgi:hypothetical protein